VFLTDAAILPSLAAQLKVDPSAIDGTWTTLLADCHVRAYGEIRRRILQRGYTAAQLAAWDDGPELERDITLWWTLTQGAGLATIDPREIDHLDRREELGSISLTNGGALVNPGKAGRVGQGDMDDSRSVFGFRKSERAADRLARGPRDVRQVKW
jgi:hypothetical protein